jgi:hypothetical protein
MTLEKQAAHKGNTKNAYIILVVRLQKKKSRLNIVFSGAQPRQLV